MIPTHDPWLQRIELPPSEEHQRYHLRELRRRRARADRSHRVRISISAALRILAERIAP